MRMFITSIIAVCITCSVAQATPITFDFAGGGGNVASITSTVDGLTVTLTPGMFDDDNNNFVSLGGDFVINREPNGLAVTQAGATGDRIDGDGADELIALSFNQAVRLESVLFGAVDSDDDFAFFFDSEGDGVLSDNLIDSDIPIPTSTDLVVFANTFSEEFVGRTFGIGADSSDDRFLLKGFSVSTIAAVPLPAALPLYLICAAFLGLFVRRRKVWSE